MRWMKRWTRRLHNLTRSAEFSRDLEEELDFHIQMETEKNVRGGMPREEAMRRAAIAFGGAQKHREQVREARWLGWLPGFSPDVKLALRMLVRHPALTVVGGLGMGMAVAIGVGFFLFVSSFYFATLPFEEGDRIVAIENVDVRFGNGQRRSSFDYAVWRDELASMEEIGAFYRRDRNLEIPGRVTGPTEVAAMTASGFRVARVGPLLGRPIVDDDERGDAEAVVVIGYEEWLREFGGDHRVLGTEVRIGGVYHTVIGVMPEGFRFPVNDGYWVPLAAGDSRVRPGEGPEIFVFGRLAPGVTAGGAQAELRALGASMAAEFPDTHTTLRPRILPYIHPILDIQGMPVWFALLIVLASSLVLVIVAVNVGVLVYARTAIRQAEIAVRMALGATRRRIVTQLFIEAFVLSAAAATVGLLIARFGLQEVVREMESESTVPFWVATELPLGAVAYAAGLAVLAALIVGVAPALRATGRNLESRLRQMGGGAGLAMGRTWTLLIVLQVTIAVAFLPAIVGVAWSNYAPTTVRPTFPVDDFLSLRLVIEEDPRGPGAAGSNADNRLGQLQAEVVRRAELEPSVAAVTFAQSPPGGGRRIGIEVEGAVHEPDGRPAVATYNKVDPRLFDVLGVPLLAGRGFAAGDFAADASQVVVSRAFVDKILAGGEALGRRIRIVQATTADAPAADGPWLEIIGVVEDMYVNAADPDLTEPFFYQPIAFDQEAVGIFLRTRGSRINEPSLGQRLQEITTHVEPAARAIVFPLAGPELGFERRMAVGVGGLVTLSVLLLSAAGIYALMSFAVTRRRREIGIRSALGAPRSRILLTIFARVALQIAIGLVAGLLVAAGLDRLTAGGMTGGRAAIILPLIVALMAITGVVAALGPARRGLAIQPGEAMRVE